MSDSTEFIDYLSKRSFNSFLAGSIAGASIGYYLEGKTALYLYTYGISAGIFGSGFFTVVYFSRNIRNTDDVWNYSIAGGITGGLANAVNPVLRLRRGMMGLCIGAVAGAAYNLTTSWMYRSSRAAWLNNRRYILRNSVERSPHEFLSPLSRQPKFSTDSSSKSHPIFDKRSASIPEPLIPPNSNPAVNVAKEEGV